MSTSVSPSRSFNEPNAARVMPSNESNLLLLYTEGACVANLIIIAIHATANKDHYRNVTRRSETNYVSG